MIYSSSSRLLLRTAVVILGAALAASAQNPAAAKSTAWDAVVRYDSLSVPFSINIETNGRTASATLFNGDETVPSTSGIQRGDSIFVSFEHLASVLRARVVGDSLSGVFGPSNGKGAHVVNARRHRDATSDATTGAPDISGTWLMPAKSGKGEATWRFVVRQDSQRVVATILRIDGDAGAHVGTWADGRFVLNHFDGTRPSQIEVIPRPDGALEITVNSTRGRGQPVRALRPDAAVAQGLAAPADFLSHTRVKNPDEVFRFSCPDLDGRIVSNTDSRFANKVIVVAIGGTWCPNCHDEAPFLAQLYRRYRDRGVEVVGLDFEDSTQLKTLERPRAFLKKYGIEYPFLIAGATNELHSKVTIADSLDSWPTTLFIGRDGKVASIHAGFAGPASGVFHAQLIAEYDETIERLLAQRSMSEKSHD